MARLNVNGQVVSIEVDGNTPLLWVIREQLGLTGTKYGCGVAQCGACTVHIDGVATRSCTLPVSAVTAEQQIVTIEGLSPDGSHPVQKAWLALDVPQCGYCQTGMIMAAAALLQEKPSPSDADIDAGITNICRCGTYNRVRAGDQARGRGRRRFARAESGGGEDHDDGTRRLATLVPRALAASLGGLALGFHVPLGSATAAEGPAEINAWVVVKPDETVVIRIARSEMGQGTLTGLAQLVAEELECDWAKVTTEYPTPGQNLARGSACGAISRPAAAAASANRTSMSARAVPPRARC